jgi:hypothetical protein
MKQPWPNCVRCQVEINVTWRRIAESNPLPAPGIVGSLLPWLERRHPVATSSPPFPSAIADKAQTPPANLLDWNHRNEKGTILLTDPVLKVMRRDRVRQNRVEAGSDPVSSRRSRGWRQSLCRIRPSGGFIQTE